MRESERLYPRHSGSLAQPTFFRRTPEQFIAELFVSADEMMAWYRKGWLSFDPRTLTEYDEKEHIEVEFIRGIARSGLSDALIDRILLLLEKPYCFDPSTTFFSFADNRWITLAPTPEPEGIVSEYIDDLIYREDWGGLRSLEMKVSLALQHADDCDE